jgi:hypothetical protein
MIALSNIRVIPKRMLRVVEVEVWWWDHVRVWVCLLIRIWVVRSQRRLRVRGCRVSDARSRRSVCICVLGLRTAIDILRDSELSAHLGRATICERNIRIGVQTVCIRSMRGWWRRDGVEIPLQRLKVGQKKRAGQFALARERSDLLAEAIQFCKDLVFRPVQRPR